MTAKQVMFHEDAHAQIVRGAAVLGPRKVARAARQNAASIAGLILTADCMVGGAGRGAAAGAYPCCRHGNVTRPGI